MYGYHSLLRDASFLASLLDLDREVCEQVRAGACACGGPLHLATYPRKPRGVIRSFETAFSRRLSLCCGSEGCRKRVTPPSVCFLGRRAYLGVAFVLLSMLRHGITSERERQLRRELHAEFPVDDRTLRRWRAWWCRHLPATPFWRVAKGLLKESSAIVDLPGSLLEKFAGDAGCRLKSALQFLSPLSTSSSRFGSGFSMVA